MRSNFMWIVLALAAVVGEAIRCKTPAPKKTWTVVSQEHTEEYKTIKESYFDDERFKECLAAAGKTLLPSDVSEPKEVYGRKKRDMRKHKVAFGQGGVFPVLVSSNYSDCELVIIANALKHFEQRTCLSFVPYVDHVSTPKPFLITYYSPKCFSVIPVLDCLIDGETKVKCIKINCYGGDIGGLRHEIAHAIGFIHEQESPWRPGPAAAWTDWTYVQSDKSTLRQEPWDIDSVSSYLGIRNFTGMTDWDAYKVNQAYNCTKTTRGGLPIDMNNKPEMPYQIPDMPENKTTWVGPDPNNCSFIVARGNNTVRFNAGTLIIDDRNNTRYMAPNYNYTNPFFCAVGRFPNCLVGLIHFMSNGTVVNKHSDYGGREEKKSGCFTVRAKNYPHIPWRYHIIPGTEKLVCNDVVYMNGRTSCVIW